MTELADDYPRLLARGVPLVDLRSPGEFARGAFPGAVNLPLLTDDERRQVGIRYKQAGSDAAIDLGNRLVSGDLKESRVQGWRDFVGEHPDAVLYCWRGGLRSEIAQAWLADVGRAVPRVAGGYKALRNFCMRTLTREFAWVILAGRPGSDKTGILGDLTRNVDLEGLANHRGSAFGQRATPQPPPITFENALAVRLLQLTAEAPVAPDTAAEAARRTIAIEDESRTIGRLAVPAAIFEGMQRAPVVVVEAEREARLARIHAQYVGTDPGPGAGSSRDSTTSNVVSATSATARCGPGCRKPSRGAARRHTMHGSVFCSTGTTIPCTTTSWRKSRIASCSGATGTPLRITCAARQHEVSAVRRQALRRQAQHDTAFPIGQQEPAGGAEVFPPNA